MKVCKKCGEEKADGDFQRKGGKCPGQCEACYRKKIKEYNSRPDVRERARAFHKTPDAKERAKDYRQRPDVRERRRLQHRGESLARSRRPEVKDVAKEYNRRPEVKERLSKWAKAYFSAQTNSVGDQYVKHIIRRKTKGILKAKDIPSGLIEAQRQSLILKRTIKQKQQQNEQHDPTDV